ncbi:Type IIS restriction enzyme Eco57I [Chryseobacterium aquaeductus]|uniref:site-specific DNA-methyltransferase (adenine-specific) n=1 Tax=Chryseobacterium aquaeductus TaxID=2675056 RepID=A0A9N8QQJ5_9FLAO|nr:N-6 DNA methylase [Chryseobacterium aquaeductus]CAA7330896.1 Type IIS restriction enzyme Eco57I [Chryseobacterium potabilaquae]CAD7806850.1 Type IIS restriction enzyme Eco57I [Chryseobacterium aquaeductus]
MNQNILNYLKEYSYEEQDINRLLVSSFLYINKVEAVNNRFIRTFIIDNQSDLEKKQLDKFIPFFEEKFDIEDLLELFEFVISPEDKEINGAVYTPKYIREYIVNSIIKEFEKTRRDLNDIKFGDIACGCGGFFKTITEEYKRKTNKTFFDIYNQNIFGVDIQQFSITRTQILLSLYAIINGEDCEEFRFNLYEKNSLDFNWFEDDNIMNNNGLDAIVGNPPYVGSSNLDDNTKSLMKNWSVSSTGKLDLYIPFFQIGLKWLSDNGILGYITVNNFYRSLNGRALRKFFSENSFDFKLIDFGSEQVFKSRLTYTCICQIKKSHGDLFYTNTSPQKIEALRNKDFIHFDYKQLNDYDGWQLDDAKTQLNLSKLENTGKKLGDLFSIRNGFATLRNSIYLFKPIEQDELFYYFEKNGERFQVEREICRDAIKPNILKSEKDLEVLMEKIIFPYNIIEHQNNQLFQNQDLRSVKTIEEKTFQNNFPNAYNYLVYNKKELAKRDKGKRDYEIWYAYGRNQALNISGLKLLFPYISDAPYFVYTNEKDLLFYNGYALVSDSENDLKFVQKLLKTDVFWYYIKRTSKPYANDYFALAKNYIKNFSIPSFTQKEKESFMRLQNKESINKFLLDKYNITDIEL